MAHLIVTGCYTSNAMKGMLANPSDRGAATSALVEAAGGKMLSYYMTTGDNDFMIIVDVKDGADIIAPLLAAGATGTVSNLKTIRGFTSAEFLTAQKKAAQIGAKFKPAA